MDSNPFAGSYYNPPQYQNAPDPGAKGAYNATGCSGKQDPTIWLGYWPSPKIDIHWEKETLDGLNKCLSDGWKDYRGLCFD